MRMFKKQLVFLWLALQLASVSAFAQDAYFTSGGVKLHYTVQGKGEPVILIHGFAVNILMNWAGVQPALTPNYKVIAIDNRGHGLSEKPTTPEAYGTKFVDDVIALMDHLKITKAHVVGYSMGAFITNKLLTTHPQRLLTATLGGAGWSHPDEDQAALIALAESLEQGKGLGPLFTFLTPKGQPPPTEETIQSTNKMILSFNNPHALAAVARSMGALAVPEDALRANKVPTLALIGEIDPLKAGVDRLDGVMANLKIVVIPKANHMTAFSDPAFISNLKSFLAEHPAEAKAKAATAGAK